MPSRITILSINLTRFVGLLNIVEDSKLGMHANAHC